MNYSEYVCEVHPFIKEQVCYARRGNDDFEFVGIVPLESLCDFLVCNCHNNDVKRIHLVGPASYLNKYMEDIKYEESCRYGNCTIEVRIN